MSNKIKVLLGLSLLVLNINVFGAPVISSGNLAVGQPMYSDLDVNWIILGSVKYKNKLFYECKISLFGEDCNVKGYNVNQVLDMLVGKGNSPVGISPFVSQNGKELGVILYYKKE